MSDPSQDKKIIVDEDWKSRVQAEKETAKQRPGEESAEDGAAGATQDVPFPPASLEILIGSLATQAMVSLGIIPNPITKKPERLLSQAKHVIDTLQVLQEKTEGNRTTGESALLDDTLHQLRMAYVQISQAPGESGS